VADDKRAGEVITRLRGLLKKRASQPSSVDLNEVVSDAFRLLVMRRYSETFRLRSNFFRVSQPCLETASNSARWS
jgi:phosphoglycerate-specific signal transduction histidine kinase